MCFTKNREVLGNIDATQYLTSDVVSPFMTAHQVHSVVDFTVKKKSRTQSQTYAKSSDLFQPSCHPLQKTVVRKTQNSFRRHRHHVKRRL